MNFACIISNCATHLVMGVLFFAKLSCACIMSNGATHQVMGAQSFYAKRAVRTVLTARKKSILVGLAGVLSTFA